MSSFCVPAAAGTLSFIFLFQMPSAVLIVSWYGEGEKKQKRWKAQFLTMGSDTCLRYRIFSFGLDSCYLGNEETHKWVCYYCVFKWAKVYALLK